MSYEDIFTAVNVYQNRSSSSSTQDMAVLPPALRYTAVRTAKNTNGGR